MKFVIFCAVLATGCATPDYFNVDCRFTPEEVAAIHQAADEWLRATGATIDLLDNQRVDLDTLPARRSIVKTTSRNPAARELKQDPTGWQSVAFDHITDNGPLGTNEVLVVYADQVASLPQFRFVMMHEFGHHLGLPHLEFRNAVMYPKIDDDGPWLTSPTEIDVDAYRFLYGAN